MGEPIISVAEAGTILGKKAEKMSDEQVAETIQTLDELAKAALEEARKKRLEQDAAAMAELIYDIYQDKKKMVHPRNDTP